MKIAISLSKEDFLAIEKLKVKFKKSRSELIQEAIGSWLAGRREKELIEQYERGYKNKPESIDEIKVLEQLSAQAFQDEGLK